MSLLQRSRGILILVALSSGCQPHVEVARQVDPPGAEPPTEAAAEPTPPAVAVETFATAAEAFAAILEREPEAEVIALGEAHRTKGSPAVRSSLSRFTTELLPLLKGRASDLVIETWVAEKGGRCGEPAQEVVADVQETTRRPGETEQEIIALIEASRARGIRPHILEMSCHDYESVFVEGEVDYDQMLRVLTRLLREKAIRLRDVRVRRAGRWPSTVVIYGGHIHNDLYPEAEVEAYSFGPALRQALVGYYVEVDLLVPELIEDDENLARQEWFAAFRARQPNAEALLFQRGLSSWVVVLPRTSGH